MAEDFLKNAIDQVADLIDGAINSNDYTDLSRRIGGLMRDVVDSASGKGSVSPGQESARQAAARKAAERDAARRAAEERAAREREAEKYFAAPKSETGPKIISVLGAIGTALFGLMTLLFGLFTALSNQFVGDISGPLAVFTGILTACCIAMGVFGRRAARKNVRFKSYRKLIMPKLYAKVSDLSAEMKLPEKTVVSDLEEFTRKGMIPQGRFDDEKKTFMASNEIYGYYRDAMAKAEQQREAEAAEARKNAAYSPEVREILEKGNSYIALIRNVNDDIPDEEISEKLDRMEKLVRRIFEEVSIRPELAGKLNMFMNYYLPTTAKLVTAYRKMDHQQMQGENIRKAKKEIANSLDMINDAFETILDSFFSEQAMDVSSDISVMRMMMKQEGLTEDDMSAQRKRKAREEAAARAAAQAQAAQAAGQVQAAGQAQAYAAGQAQVQTESKES